MNHQVDMAEAKSRKRAILLLLLAGAITIDTFLQMNGTSVSTLSMNLAWFALVAFTALNLTALPFSMCAKPVGTIMNDEMTQLFRLKSLAAGFWMSIAAILTIFIVNIYVPVSGMDVARVVVATALVSALITFSTLELRASH